jgi:hypothetical protein
MPQIKDDAAASPPSPWSAATAHAQGTPLSRMGFRDVAAFPAYCTAPVADAAPRAGRSPGATTACIFEVSTRRVLRISRNSPVLTPITDPD